MSDVVLKRKINGKVEELDIVPEKLALAISTANSAMEVARDALAEANDTKNAIPAAASAAPKAHGTAAVGTSAKYAREDHVHPAQTIPGNMKGATASEAGTAGLAPAPVAGAANRYLRSDGTWAIPPDNNTTYSAATQSANGLMSAADKKKLDGIASGATNTAAPPAAASAVPKAHGTATVGTSAKYAREDHVHPSNNTDTHWTTHLYVGASNGSVNAATTNGNTCLMVLDNNTVRDRRVIKGAGSVSVTSDANGNITISGTDTNTTYGVATQSANGLLSAADKKKLDGIAAGATANGNMKGATTSAAGTAGLAPAPAKGAANRYLRSDGTWQVPPDNNTTYGAATQSANGLMSAADKKKLDGIASGATKTAAPVGMKGATTSAAGTAGYVPAPAKGNANRYLRSDGTWQVPPDNNTTYGAATQSASGLMSAADKKKLDGIASGAQANPSNIISAQGVSLSSGQNNACKLQSSSDNVYLPSGGSYCVLKFSTGTSGSLTNVYRSTMSGGSLLQKPTSERALILYIVFKIA